MSAPRIRRWITLATLLVLAAGGALAARRYLRKPPVVTYETTKIQKSHITARVTASGTLSALVTVLVGSQVSGRISAIYVDYNSPVKKGEVLAKLDPQLFQANVEQARANYLAAKGQHAKALAQATNADKQLARTRELAEKRLVAEADLDTAEAAAASAKADVEASKGSIAQTQAQLRQAEVNLGYATIVSPVDGIVISRSIDVGQTVAASLQAPTLFTIAEDLARMQVDTSVAEADVGKLTAGMTATFNVDAYPYETFKGTVRQIRNAPQTVQNVVTYDAVIDVDNAALKLKPGMTANVTFISAERTDVLAVPNAALRFRPSPEVLAIAHVDAGTARDGGGHGGRARGGAAADGEAAARAAQSTHRAVWVKRGDALERVSVTIGLTDGSLTEIVDGKLEAGDDVVTDATAPEGAAPAPTKGPSMGGMRRIL